MNNIDNSRQQYQMYGNQVQLGCVKPGTTFHFESKNLPLIPIEPQNPPQNEKTLLRTLVSEMSRSGNFEEAMRLLCDTIEEMEKRIKELEEK